VLHLPAHATAAATDQCGQQRSHALAPHAFNSCRIQDHHLNNEHWQQDNMDNEPKLSHRLEPHAQPDLSQQEIKDIVDSPNCVNLQIDPTNAMRPMRLTDVRFSWRRSAGQELNCKWFCWFNSGAIHVFIMVNCLWQLIHPLSPFLNGGRWFDSRVCVSLLTIELA